MGLKHELQKITEPIVRTTNRGLQDRLDSLGADDLASEIITSIGAYPGLNTLVQLVFEQALQDGLSIEQAFQRGTGASHAILALTTIADILELPPL